MSVTAVPLRPIQRGSVRRFWLAAILVLALAFVLAWAGSQQFGRTESGLRYQITQQGTGGSPTREDFALVAYKGMLPDGTVFDENPGAPMELASTVPGFSEAVTLLQKGGSLRVWIPAELGYGANPPPGGAIPPDSPLQFDIRLIEFKTRAEIMETQRMMQMQQMMQQQMGGPPPEAMEQGGQP
ncbi:putative peptidyl-prolyl cis-trans isomerase [Sphingobium sp. SYK-6]|uniref:FKBP-type peptidyl-prolyl cis-trans isomerase n=1 Tax=Sphingobium sp. (strain NBRC 103272 / SYK-6) TaxID=627192 RepID=UPI0002276BE1|nr:FKBP-type peptidyl-prolyl cis-trans isomerase [Sphingobium sp. SYK-6]BAK65505.1 putative peptidyl-prolyl cis-trans isomerase [Sphingobium sp. SYK-6]